MHERPRSTLLLCELHSHTTWSDGALSPRALVDLYGEHGFDVLCITDHTHRSGHPGWRGIPAERFSFYVQELEREAVRARELYDLILIPGAELTDGNDDPARSGHALAVGLREFVSLDAGLPEALLTARAAGAALIAAHPSSGDDNGAGLRAPTRLFWQEREALTELVDRFELVNRHQAFAWVAEERLPAVATGDFHRLEHLFTWKTLLPCARSEDAVVDCLRSHARAYLTAFEPSGTPFRLAA